MRALGCDGEASNYHMCLWVPLRTILYRGSDSQEGGLPGAGFIVAGGKDVSGLERNFNQW